MRERGKSQVPAQSADPVRFDRTNCESAGLLTDGESRLVAGAPPCESIPGKVSGAWVFRGPRMPVKTVFENLEAGMSVDEITEVFDVTPEEIRAVLHFASESLSKAPAFG